MNIGRTLLALVCLGGPLGLAAQSQLAGSSFASDSSSSTGDVRKELHDIVFADAKGLGDLAPPQVKAMPVATPEGVVSMDPYIVRNRGIPTVKLPVYETALYRFVKTGTIAQAPMDWDGLKTDMRVFALTERGGGGAGRLSLAFNFAW